MTSLVVTLLILWLHTMPATIDASRILGIFIHPGRSHFESFHPIMNGLARKGHDVTVLSYFGNYSEYPNCREIIFDGAPEGFAHMSIGIDTLVSIRRKMKTFDKRNSQVSLLFHRIHHLEVFTIKLLNFGNFTRGPIQYVSLP